MAALLLLLQLLIEGFTVTANPLVPTPRSEDYWVERHERFKAQAKRLKADVLFIGDSITHSWEGEGAQVWRSQIGPLRAANLGIGGDRVEVVRWRMQNGELPRHPPRVIVLLIGTNNLADDSVEDVLEGYRLLVQELLAKYPRVKILQLAIFPRVDDWFEPFQFKIPAVNEELAGRANGKGTFYLDLTSSLRAGTPGVPREIMFDGLHLTPRGYQLWADGMMPLLRKLLSNSSAQAACPSTESVESKILCAHF